MRNKYVEGAHISERQFRVILRLFSEDLTATQISHLVGISGGALVNTKGELIGSIHPKIKKKQSVLLD